MDERFDFPEIRPAEFVALRERLARESFAERVGHQESLIPRRAQLTGQPIGKRIISYLISVSRLTWTRRQTGVLEDEIGALRQALVGVTGEDLSALAGKLAEVAGHGEQEARQREALDRRRIDGERALERKIAALEDELAEVRRRLQFERLTRQRAFGDFDRRLAQGVIRGAAESAPAAPETPAGVQSLLESFYHLLEDRHRGTREEIKQRLLVYRNDWRAARDRVGADGPVIDIGCGRGELVELLVEDGLRAIGIDSSEVQLEAARQHGCPVVRADALDYLRGLKSGSVLAVSAIHVVEHIPFPALAQLLLEVARVLAPGGLALLETPNPRNLIVGATTFHFDPTHIRPLPPEVLQILLETVGFSEVETRPLHPSPTLEHMVRNHGLDRHLANLLFGPQDYAALGVMA